MLSEHCQAVYNTTTPSSSYVAVASEMLQKLDFSQRSLRQDLLAEDICDLLDSDTFPSLTVGRSTISKYVSAF
jgi:hypothetical protein